MQTRSDSAAKSAALAPAKRDAASDASTALRLDQIRPSVPELLALHERKGDAAAQYKDAIDAIAAKGGVNKKALNRYIKARAMDEMAKEHAVTAQLALLFEEI